MAEMILIALGIAGGLWYAIHRARECWPTWLALTVTIGILALMIWAGVS